MTDYGSDIGGIDDVDAALTFVEGPRVVAEALCCRLGNIQGTTEDDPSNGNDLTLLIGSVIDTASEERKIVDQMKADERVSTARATVVQNGATLVVTIQVVLIGGESFTMVLDVSAARVALVDFNFKEAA